MAQRYIYLPDELNNKLKEEDNASAIIVKLLLDYYKEQEAPEKPQEEQIGDNSMGLKAEIGYQLEMERLNKMASIRKQWEKDNPEGSKVDWEKYIKKCEGV